MLEILGLVLVVGVILWTYHGLNRSIDSNEGKKSEPSLDTPVAPVLTQAAPCGCGRSTTGFCVGLHKLTEEEWAVHEDNPNKKKPRRTRKSKDISTLPE